MAGDCTYNRTAHYDSAGGAGGGGHWKGRGRLLPPPPHSPHFEVIDGLLYRKKLERGFLNYREVLGEERQREAISTFHRRRRADGAHLSFEETYRSVADNYWWDGMYFHIRSHVLGCPECQRTKKPEEMLHLPNHCLINDVPTRWNSSYEMVDRLLLLLCVLGFSEESLLPLLDFSYSSTLRVQRENLQEVSAMARHLGMWPALEACSALLREQQQQQQTAPPTPPTLRCSRTGPGDSSPSSRPCELKPDRKRKRFSLPEVPVEDVFHLALDASPCRRVSARSNPRLRGVRPKGTPPQNGGGLHVHSPTHTRMKLMDFKSPFCKKKAPASRSTPATPPPPPPRHVAPVQSGSFTPSTLTPSTSTLPLHSPHARLLRSTPGAAQEVQRLQPRPESPRKSKRRPGAIPRRRPRPTTPATAPARRRQSSGAGATAVSPAPRVKQEPRGGQLDDDDDDDDDDDYDRAQEKYRLMMVLGLQRTALLPRPEVLVGWRQKKRLRKLKANNYCLTKRRTLRPAGPEQQAFGRQLPLCDARFLARVIKAEPGERLISGGEEEEEVRVKRRSTPCPPRPRAPPPSDRSMRSRGAPPPPLPSPSPHPRPRPRAVPCAGGELRRSPGMAQSTPLRTLPATAVLRMIKAEPMDFFISGPPPPPSNSRHRDDGKHASRAAPCYNGHRAPSRAKVWRVAARQGAPPRGEKEGGGRRRRGGGGGQRSLKAVHEGSSPPGPQADKPDGLEASVPTATTTTPPSVYSHPLYKVIKEEPADLLPVAAPHHPASPDHLGKRQSKPPIKLLDPGFLFSFCRPGGGGGGVKREEESVDICLTRSVSREKFSAPPAPRVLRPRDGGGGWGGKGPATVLHRVKPERVERNVSRGRGQRRACSQPHHHRTTTTTASTTTSTPRHQAKRTRPKATQSGLKRQQGGALASSSRQCPLLESPRHSRLKHLRPPGPSPLRHPRGADPWVPGGHTCLHKTFFWLRNVRKHIRTHDQKLYKCRSCLPTSSSSS
ncbi:hypothetical protein CRUP_006350 [Coryphaenoides rupestris]|nr:hypothetical protein CRUP_006350 [Coryphaenoides rupestris]